MYIELWMYTHRYSIIIWIMLCPFNVSSLILPSTATTKTACIYLFLINFISWDLLFFLDFKSNYEWMIWIYLWKALLPGLIEIGPDVGNWLAKVSFGGSSNKCTLLLLETSRGQYNRRWVWISGAYLGTTT